MYQEWDSAAQHSIREAVISVGLLRPVSQQALDKLESLAKSEFRSELPRVERTAQSVPFELPFPAGHSPELKFGSGLQLSSFKSDGTLAWRLLVEGQQIILNCLEYPGWESFLPRSLRYINSSLDVLDDDAPIIYSVNVQYLNGFRWVGADRANMEENLQALGALLRSDNPELPGNFWQRASFEFHVNQGYHEFFVGLSRRLLHQSNLHATNQGTELHLVLDINKQMEFGRGAFLSRSEFASEGEELLRNLRGSSRKTLRQYLSDDMLHRIGALEI